MKPKTKFQHKVVEASKSLPELSPAQIRWACTHVIEPIGRRTSKGEITCLDCGEVFHNTTSRKRCTCPHCGAKLRIEQTRKLRFEQHAYAAFITACDGLYQYYTEDSCRNQHRDYRVYACIESTAEIFFPIPYDFFVPNQTDDAYCKTDYCKRYIPKVETFLGKGIVPYFKFPKAEAYYKYG